MYSETQKQQNPPSGESSEQDGRQCWGSLGRSEKDHCYKVKEKKGQGRITKFILRHQGLREIQKNKYLVIWWVKLYLNLFIIAVWCYCVCAKDNDDFLKSSRNIFLPAFECWSHAELLVKARMVLNLYMPDRPAHLHQSVGFQRAVLNLKHADPPDFSSYA